MLKHLSLLLLLLPLTTNAQNEMSCDSVFEVIYQKWDEVENMSYHSYKKERKLGEYEEAEFDFVVQREPYSVAGLMTDKGHRIMFDPSQNQSQALYIPSGFPYTNLWLDVHGKLFRGLNHYTISDAGCEFIFSIIRNEYLRMPENFTCQFYEKTGTKEIEIYAETDDFTYFEYTAKPGENILDIAKKHHAMAYLILEQNQNIVDDYEEDCEGKTLKIPSHYGSSVRLVVDASHGMPTLIEVFDRNGLIQRYQYSNYQFNKDLPADYFTEDYLDELD